MSTSTHRHVCVLRREVIDWINETKFSGAITQIPKFPRDILVSMQVIIPPQVTENGDVLMVIDATTKDL